MNENVLKEIHFNLRFDIALFVFLFGVFAYFMPAEPGWNVNSRLALTYAVIDNHSLMVDEFCLSEGVYTKDIAFFNDHYYSDKIIGTSLLGLPGYSFVRIIEGIKGGSLSWEIKRYFTTLFSTCFFAALSGVLLFRIFLLLNLSALSSLILSIIYCFGTLIFPYSFLFMPYAPANLAIIMVLYLMIKNFHTPEILPLLRTGFLLGIAILCDYTYFLAAAGIFIYIFAVILNKKDILRTVIGAAIPCVLFAVYLFACFHKIVIPYQLEENEVFKKGMSSGLLGITLPNFAVLYYITFHSYRGLFFYSPVLIFGLIGILINFFNNDFRKISLLSLWVLIAYLYLNASYYMWWGGWTNGARLLIPLIPFLMLQTGILAKRNKYIIPLIFIAGIISIFLTFIPAAVDPQTPQGYQKDAPELISPSFSAKPISPVLKAQIPRFFRGEAGLNLGVYLFNLNGGQSFYPLFVWIMIFFVVFTVFIFTSKKEPKPYVDDKEFLAG